MEYPASDIEWLMKDYRAAPAGSSMRCRRCRSKTLTPTTIRKDGFVTAIRFECCKCNRQLVAELATPFCSTAP
jgi:hypothetical protein